MNEILHSDKDLRETSEMSGFVRWESKSKFVFLFFFSLFSVATKQRENKTKVKIYLLISINNESFDEHKT